MLLLFDRYVTATYTNNGVFANFNGEIEALTLRL
jgi:hypothetical protein